MDKAGMVMACGPTMPSFLVNKRGPNQRGQVIADRRQLCVHSLQQR
jgi:hypothetical protein